MKTIIRVNYAEIFELLRVDSELIESLISKRCFKREQLESKTGSPVGRKMKLLDKFRRGNMRNFNRFCRYLLAAQPQIVPLLTGEAGEDSRRKLLIFRAIAS